MGLQLTADLRTLLTRKLGKLTRIQGYGRSPRHHRTAESLNEIGLKFDTDKSSRHHDFLDLYERFLEPIRYKRNTMLEIGVWTGGSLRMWEKYFPSSTVIGIDNDPVAKQHQGGRIQIETADQSRLDHLLEIGQRFGPFELVIDDGSHLWDHQILTLKTMLPFVKPGGLYILEDIDTSLGAFAHRWNNGAATSALSYLYKLSDFVIGDRPLDLKEAEDAFIEAFAPKIATITLSRRTAIIQLR